MSCPHCILFVLYFITSPFACSVEYSFFFFLLVEPWSTLFTCYTAFGGEDPREEITPTWGPPLHVLLQVVMEAQRPYDQKKVDPMKLEALWPYDQEKKWTPWSSHSLDFCDQNRPKFWELENGLASRGQGRRLSWKQ